MGASNPTPDRDRLGREPLRLPIAPAARSHPETFAKHEARTAMRRAEEAQRAARDQAAQRAARQPTRPQRSSDTPPPPSPTRSRDR